MNILITGGTGFIGLNFVPALLKKEHQVKLLCRDKEKAIRLFGSECEIIVGDVTKKETLIDCCKDIDIVFHMVAKVGNELPNEETIKLFREVNVDGLQNMINEAKKSNVKKFISISSIAAMGIVHENIISEKSRCSPYLPYQISKFEGEKLLLKEFKENKFPGIIIRPTKIYGHGEQEYSYLTLAKLCKKGIFPQIGNGNNYTSNVYISDLVQGLVNLVDKGVLGETYILTSNDSISMSDSATIIANELGVKILFIHIPSWLMIYLATTIERISWLIGRKPLVTRRNIEATVTDRIYDISKAIKEIDFSPSKTMEEGIKEVIKYYKERKLI